MLLKKVSCLSHIICTPFWPDVAGRGGENFFWSTLRWFGGIGYYILVESLSLCYGWVL